MFAELTHTPSTKGLPGTRAGSGKWSGTDLASASSTCSVPVYSCIPVHPHCWAVLGRTPLLAVPWFRSWPLRRRTYSSFSSPSAAALLCRPPYKYSLLQTFDFISHISEHPQRRLSCTDAFIILSLCRGELGTCHSLSSLAGKAAESTSANKEPQNTDEQKVTFYLNSPSFLIVFQTVRDTRWDWFVSVNVFQGG